MGLQYLPVHKAADWELHQSFFDTDNFWRSYYVIVDIHGKTISKNLCSEENKRKK